MEESIQAIWKYTDWIRSLSNSIIVVPNNEVYREFLKRYKDEKIYLKGTEPKNYKQKL